MVINNKNMLIEKLTGIHSSKKSYYVELKKKVSELSKRNIQLEIINQLAKNMGINMSYQEIIENIMPKLQTLVYFNILSLYVVMKDDLIKRIVFFTGNSHKISESYFNYSQLEKSSKNDSETDAALWYVLHEKKPLLHNNLSSKGCSFPEDIKFIKQGITSKILIPLLVNEEVIGYWKRQAESHSARTTSFLQQVADQLAVCLENVRLYNEVWQHKQEWEITFSAVTDLLLFINLNYEIQRVNRAAIDFYPEGKGYTWQKCYHILYGRESNVIPAWPIKSYGVKTAYLQNRTRYNRVLDIFAYPAYMENEEPYGVTYYGKDVTSIVDSIKFVSLGEMSAGVAHELNSPLTAIVGDSQLLLRETPPESPHYQLIKDIQLCGVRCQRIIQNLLTFSRQDEFTFEEIDLNQVVEKALNLAAYQIEKSKINLVKNLDESPLMILGNAQGLEQIIINLLLNAKDAVEQKHMENDEQEKGEIIISTRIKPDKFVAVDIADNGCGIDQKKISQVFNPFYTSKKVGKGTGLGLSVSLGTAQSHGGFIDVESEPGKGSIFSLILPIKKFIPDEEGENPGEKD